MGLSALDALREIQRQLAKKKADVVPPGFKTVAEWSKEAGRDRRTCEKTLIAGTEHGLIDKKNFTVIVNGQTRVNVSHYRMIEPKKK